jgi:hypothetical protein
MIIVAKNKGLYAQNNLQYGNHAAKSLSAWEANKKADEFRRLGFKVIETVGEWKVVNTLGALMCKWRIE